MQLKSGRRLEREQVTAIVNLVASSIPELDAKQVTVVDSQGRILFGDQLLQILAAEVLARHPGKPIIADHDRLRNFRLRSVPGVVLPQHGAGLQVVSRDGLKVHDDDLRHAAERPDLLDPHPGEMLRRAANAGLLDQADAERLRTTRALLTDVQSLLRLTLDGKPLPGFSLEDCLEHYGDSVEQIVSWKGGSDVSSLAGKPVRLRFVLADGDVYSFRFEE